MFGFLKGLFGEAKPAGKPIAKAVGKPGAKTPAKARPAAAAGDSRAELMREAMRVHKAKRKILDHLSDEDRAKLVGMAILTFLNEGRAPDSSKK